MKRTKIFSFIGFACLLLLLSACLETDLLWEEYFGSSPGHGNAGKNKIPALITADELDRVKDYPGVVLVDLRTEEEYLAGHIPGSVNLPFTMPACGWCMSDTLLMELPGEESFEAYLSHAGISNNSKIVLISGVAVPPNPPYPLANATRAVATLNYFGLTYASILDGGFAKWIAEIGYTNTGSESLSESYFDAEINPAMVVNTDYVKTAIGNKILIDARDAEVYSGEVVEPWAGKPGHIPTALSLPAVSFWNSDGTYKSKEELNTLVKNAIGNIPKCEEIIVYCGVGGYASAAYFVLHNILGYKNVKIYDGAAQAWVLENEMEM